MPVICIRLSNGFAHVVNGQRGDAHGGEGFHLDAGLRGDAGAGGDDDAIARLGNLKPTSQMRDGQGMAERDEVASAFGAMMPASRAVARTLPLATVARDQLQRGF